jgi:proteasome lid subunit RPN8/RPN11
MNDFQKISRIILPVRFVNYVYEHLRTAGEAGVECVALWLGRQEGNLFTVYSCVVPAQNGYRLEEGLLYNVGGEELHRINKWAYEQQIVLFAQIHSHPGRAYHSETDDAYPIVATLGGFSIVIPNFGSDPIDIKYWKVYRLQTDGWKEVAEADVNELFQIE